MGDLAAKSNYANPQKEGSRVVLFSKGSTQIYGGTSISPSGYGGVLDGGFMDVPNARWGNRSMGNGGLIE